MDKSKLIKQIKDAPQFMVEVSSAKYNYDFKEFKKKIFDISQNYFTDEGSWAQYTFNKLYDAKRFVKRARRLKNIRGARIFENTMFLNDIWQLL